MIDFLLYISWICAGLLAYFVLWYTPNMDKHHRQKFWTTNIIFLGSRALALTLSKLQYITADQYELNSAIVSIFITAYFCVYIHKTYGARALTKKAEEDLIGAKANFLESLPMICCIKEYVDGEFICIYVNPAFNEKVHKVNNQPPFGCVGTNNSYWGEYKAEYDRQDLEAWNGHNVKVDADIIRAGCIVTERFYKYRFGNHLFVFGMF